VGVDVFRSVPRHELRKAGRRRRFDRGEVVFHRDDPGDSLHRVESGRFAARIITPLGDVATVGLHGPGDVFGLLAVVNPSQRRTVTVVALEPAETLAIPASAFLRLRADHPAVRDAVDQLLATWLAATTDRLVEALYTPATARVRFQLVQLAELYGDLEAGEVTIPLSQDHVAGLSGTTRETVNRVLRQEQERGAVRVARGRIVATPVLLHEHPPLDEGRRRRAADEGPTVADPSSVGVKRGTPPARTPFASPAQRRGTR
jgi:CRP/FNR family cyclic AMP-dependent transcriptional regulator